MDYAKIYSVIINNAQTLNRSKQDSYYEAHHILPQSLGGSNKKENIVLLTPREHFICHVLLVKMYATDSNAYRRMLHALMLMKGGNSHQSRYIGSKLYESMKLKYSEVQRQYRLGKKMSSEQKKKISDSMMGHETSQETRNKIAEKAKSRKRAPFSDEYKQRMSEIMKERHRWKNAE